MFNWIQLGGVASRQTYKTKSGVDSCCFMIMNMMIMFLSRCSIHCTFRIRVHPSVPVHLS